MSSFVDYINKAHELFGEHDVLSKQIIDNKKLLIKHYLENNSIDNEFVRNILETNKDNLYDNLKEYFQNLYSDLENNKYYENENEYLIISEKILVLTGNSNNDKYENLVFEYNENDFYEIYWNDKIILDNKELFKLYIEKGGYVNNYGFTPLHAACARGYTEIVELLIEKDVYVNITDIYGKTPLHYACKNGHTEIVKLLIEAGVDIAVYGKTPLHYACKNGHTEIVKLLIEAGVIITDRYGKTPLHHACEKGHTEIVKLLIEKGANVNATDRYGKTPLHYACKNGHTEIVKLLNDVNIKIVNVWTLLYIACKQRYTKIVNLFN
jgi:ankyrin repeat protein